MKTLYQIVHEEEYDARFALEEKVAFASGGFSPAQVNEFDERFNGQGIRELLKANVQALYANSYRGRFSQYDVIQFISCSIPPEEAATIYDEFDLDERKRLEEMHIPYDELLDTRDYIWYFIMRAILTYYEGSQNDIIIGTILTPPVSNRGDLTFLTTGSKAIILVDQDAQYVAKFSAAGKEEIDLLQELETFSGTSVVQIKPENIVRVRRDPVNYSPVIYDEDDRVVGFRLEYIRGLTLEELIALKGKDLKAKDNGRFEDRYDYPTVLDDSSKGYKWMKAVKLSDDSSTFTYYAFCRIASGILKGLDELFETDIVHRDLHPGNVVVAMPSITPYIIDFGIAMKLKDDYPSDPKDCRRYGGFDDLFSYGLLLYKMATGKHLLVDYVLAAGQEQQAALDDYVGLKSHYSTRGNADWVKLNKDHILTETGEVREEYVDFIRKRLPQKGYCQLDALVIKSLGVIGYINRCLEIDPRVTIDELRAGKKLPYVEVKRIKKRLMNELKEEIKAYTV